LFKKEYFAKEVEKHSNMFTILDAEFNNAETLDLNVALCSNGILYCHMYE
jgi:hypothetical protein